MQKEITKKLPNSLKILLAYRNTPTLIALLFLIIGLIFYFFYLKDFDFREYFKLKGSLAQTTGIITKAYYTGVSNEIGDNEGIEYINAFEYEYKVANEDHKWLSYSGSAPKKVGDKVSIKYNKNAPAYSVIQNYDARPNGNSAVLLLLFPLIGFILLSLNLIKGIKFFIIINNGIITRGKIVQKKVLYTTDSNKKYYRLIFRYYSDSTNKNAHKTSILTGNIKQFQDESKELVIYHKNKPNMALILDDLAKPISKYIKKNWK